MKWTDRTQLTKYPRLKEKYENKTALFTGVSYTAPVVYSNADLQTMIYNHFKNYRLAADVTECEDDEEIAEAIADWHDSFAARMYEIMPAFSKLLDSAEIQIEPLKTVDITQTLEGLESLSELMEESANSTGHVGGEHSDSDATKSGSTRSADTTEATQTSTESTDEDTRTRETETQESAGKQSDRSTNETDSKSGSSSNSEQTERQSDTDRLEDETKSGNKSTSDTDGKTITKETADEEHKIGRASCRDRV